MSSISRTYGQSTANPVATGSTILAAHVNTDLDTIYSDYNGNITNANISASAAIAVSKTALGTFTPWTDYTPTHAGYSAAPTTGTARYCQIGKMCFVLINPGSTGTSNSSTTTVTLPIAAVKAFRFPTTSAVNNGVVLNTGMASTNAGSVTVDVYVDHNGGGWATSGTKYPGIIVLAYEVA